MPNNAKLFYNSFYISLCMFEMIYDIIHRRKLIGSNFFESENIKMKRIYISSGNDKSILDIYHTEKFIEDIEKGDKVKMISVFINIHNPYYVDDTFSTVYSYCVRINKTNIPFLSLKNDIISNEIIKQQHNIIVIIVKNIKSLLKKTLMDYEVYFPYNLLMNINNYYVCRTDNKVF